jgi:hypothetical protein
MPGHGRCGEARQAEEGIGLDNAAFPLLPPPKVWGANIRSERAPVVSVDGWAAARAAAVATAKLAVC